MARLGPYGIEDWRSGLGESARLFRRPSALNVYWPIRGKGPRREERRTRLRLLRVDFPRFGVVRIGGTRMARVLPPHYVCVLDKQ